MVTIRISPWSCLAIFCGGWIAGSLVVMTLLFDPNTSSRSFHDNKIPGRIRSTKLRGSSIPVHETDRNTAPPLRTLPRFNVANSSANEVIRDDEYVKPRIYMDWPVEDYRIGYENFKSLESLLTVYPNAVYRFLLPAPIDTVHHQRKLGNLLSLHTFDKYTTRGYDIDMCAIGKLDREGQASRIGRDYWSKWVSRCCLHCTKHCQRTDRTQPYHVLMFIRLVKLWRSGGIFADLSFFFLGPLDTPLINQGFFINKNCSEGTDSHANNYKADSSSAVAGGRHSITSSSSKRCFVSTLLVFNTPKSLAISCVLKKYEDLDFVLCLEHDESGAGGAHCVKEALDDCFQSLGLTNDLAQPVSHLQLLAQNLQHAGAAHLLVHAVMQSAGRGSKNDRRPASSGPLEVFDHDPIKAGRTVRSSEWGSDTLSTHTRAFWLGTAAFASPHGPWRYDTNGDGIEESDTAGSGSLLHAAVQTIRLKYHPFELNNACQHHPYLSTPPEIETNHTSSTHRHLHRRHSTSSLLVIAGFSQSAADLLTTALSTHPLMLAPLDWEQEESINDMGQTVSSSFLSSMATAATGLAVGAYCDRHLGPITTVTTALTNISTSLAVSEAGYRSHLSGATLTSRRHRPLPTELALASSPCLMTGVCVRTRATASSAATAAAASPQEQQGHSVQQSYTFSTSSSSSISISDIYERRCLAHVESSENFTRIETNVLYASMDPTRIVTSLPSDAKIVFVIRHPVDRFLAELQVLVPLPMATRATASAMGGEGGNGLSSGISSTSSSAKSSADAFTSGSGSSSSVTESSSSLWQMFADNPDMTLDDFVARALRSPDSALGMLRRMASNHSISNRIFQNTFFSLLETGYVRTNARASHNTESDHPNEGIPDNTAVPSSSGKVGVVRTYFDALLERVFLQSIYFPVLLEYTEALGADRIKVVNYDDLIPFNHRSDHRSEAIEQGLGPSSLSSSSSIDSQSEMMTLSDHTRQTLTEVLHFAGVQGQDSSSGSCSFTIPSTLYLHYRRSGRGTDGYGGGNGRDMTASSIEKSRDVASGVGVGGNTPGSDHTLDGSNFSVEEMSLRARLQLSQEMYRKLSIYFLPFTHRLMAVSTSGSTSSSSSTSSPSPTLLEQTPIPSTSVVTNTNTVASSRLDANNNTQIPTTGSSSSPSTTNMGEPILSTTSSNTPLPLTTDVVITPLPSPSHSIPSGTIGPSTNLKTLTNPFFGAIRSRHNHMVPDIATLTPPVLDISVNFTEWNHRLPPVHLPLFPYGRNHSLTQLLWFENENSAYHSKSGFFVSHLFPQKQRSVSNSEEEKKRQDLLTMF